MLHLCVNRRFVGTASLGKGLGERRRSCINKKHRISIVQTKNVIYCHESKEIPGRLIGKKSFAGCRHTNRDLGNPSADHSWRLGHEYPLSWLLHVPPGMSTTLSRCEKTNTASMFFLNATLPILLYKRSFYFQFYYWRTQSCVYMAFYSCHDLLPFSCFSGTTVKPVGEQVHNCWWVPGIGLGTMKLSIECCP